MTNRKRTTLISVLIIALCLSVCIGATYAYFTDSVESKGNIIKSGTLDVTMEYANGTTDPTNTTWTDASEGAIFNYDLWEPGYTEVYHIKIENKGTLALKYRIVIVPTGEISTTTVDGETVSLADVIDVYYADPAVQVASREALTDESKLGNLTAAIAGMGDTATGNLKAGENHTITIALKMQEDAGNKYQGLSIGTDFAIQLHATQYTYESDAFDDQYDAGAEIPCEHELTEVTENSVAPTATENGWTEGKKCSICDEILAEPTEIVPVAFTVTKSNRALVGYTGYENEVLEIPAIFEEDGTWYKVTAIDDNAFSLCSSLTSITIPDSVTSIGHSAFCECSSLTSITIPDSVTSIGGGVFQWCDNLVYNVYQNGYYLGNDTNECLVLVDVIDKTVATLTVSENTRFIYESAAENCGNLTSVNIPNSVTHIYNCAFYKCSSLTSVTFGENSQLTTIYSFVLYGCSVLTNITIPSNVTHIGNSTFGGCERLEQVVFETKNGWYVEEEVHWSDGESTVYTYAIEATALEDSYTAASYLTYEYGASAWYRTE